MDKKPEQTDSKKQQALDYHSQGRAGKLEITPTKPCLTARDLSLAYSPGVAHPCLEIAKNPDDVFKYTAKGNLVAVISNGTAVLGLGDIGPMAGKPVMEGKGVLFKKFADIDVFDLEINEKSVDGVVNAVKALEPTFGGINLEDIKAPECFEIEKRLIELMDIPVFHDDQHGTAIIASAAFINALEVSKKKINKVRVVFSGAGAASIACAELFLKLGVKAENLFMTDSKGVIYKGRTDGMNQYKEMFAVDTKLRTLSEAMNGADAFIGCSAKGVVTKEMVKSMNKNPIIFAMANPDPEITPEEVAEVRNDAIMATGRTDYTNQVNNVLGFPFIFRGALDVRAKKINQEMKLAAVYALAELAKEDVPEEVKLAYSGESFRFGPNYLIPKPFDKRVLTKVAPAVAKAAMQTGVARKQIDDINEYIRELEARLGSTGSFMRHIRSRLPNHKEIKSRIVFPEGNIDRILKAVSILDEEGLIEPVLLGEKEKIFQRMESLGLDHLKNLEVIYPLTDNKYSDYVTLYHQERKRKGASLALSADLMTRGNYFASMMVKTGRVDGMITGAGMNYPDCFRPIMRVMGTNSRSCGVIILVFKSKVLFLADCTVQVSPSAEDLAHTAYSATQLYRRLMLKDPNVAFLSYSNFGSNASDSPRTVSKAVQIAKKMMPEIKLDGEMQADVAVNEQLLNNLFSFSDMKKSADLLIFPDLNSANISYKLLAQLGQATPIGPILTPMSSAINIVQRTSSVEEIVNMSHITALMSNEIKNSKL
jgi:malate dehydrogenase (oxaloacetate-decarboxylating)(NADP+)